MPERIFDRSSVLCNSGFVTVCVSLRVQLSDFMCAQLQLCVYNVASVRVVRRLTNGLASTTSNNTFFFLLYMRNVVKGAKKEEKRAAVVNRVREG